jgi:hypothetical protein
LTLVHNTLAASIAPPVGEERMYRICMDDMKWWLNIARCHNGRWYFEPKIDTESNKNDRIHTTTAAILMLNAPLRQLHANGKGHEDRMSTRARTPRSQGTAGLSQQPRSLLLKPKEPVTRSFPTEIKASLHKAVPQELVTLSDENNLERVCLRRRVDQRGKRPRRR